MTGDAQTDNYHAKTREGTELIVREARSNEDYYTAYPILLQLIPDLDMQTYAQRVFVARATGYRMFIAELNNNVVGVIGMIHNYNLHDGFVTYIEQIVIDEDHRGKGYGALLLEFAEQRAKEDGCDLIELDTDLGENEAEAFYEKNGYEFIGKFHSKNLSKD